MGKILHLVPLIFYLLLPTVLANSSTSTQETCYTKNGPVKEHSVPTSTHTSTYHHTATVKHTTTHSKTVTPCPITVTCRKTIHTVRTITEKSSTDTYRSTSTAFTTSTSTSTATSTVTTSTSTTITESPTSTIPPSPGFTPIRTELAQEGYTLNKKLRRDRNLAKRHTTSVSKASPVPSSIAKVLFKNGKPTCEPPQYPESVSCSECINIYTTKTEVITAKETKTVSAKPSTVTKSVTTTITSTCDIIPKDASTVLHFSTTSTIHTTTVTTTTTITTITSTSTSILPTVTHYAACDPNNQIKRLNNYPIGIIVDGDSGLLTNSATTPYDCCVVCLLSPTCGGSALSLFTQAAGFNCFLAQTDGTCNPAQEYEGFETDNSDTNASDPGFVISNSNCGQWQYRGNFVVAAP